MSSYFNDPTSITYNFSDSQTVMANGITQAQGMTNAQVLA
jgi:hypothetical protein